MRLGRAFAVVALATVVAGSLALGATPASAGFESIPSYDVTLTINEDGTLLVNEVIDYDFGSVPRHGIFRDIPVRFDYPKKADTDRVYEIDVESVKASEGTPADYETEEFDDGGVGFERIKIGDPDRTITGQHTYDITYTVKGALNGFEDHDELYWNAIGQQWSVTIDQADVTVKAPADITQIACFAGPTGSTLPCAESSSDGATARFSESDLFPFNGLTVVVAIPKGVVPEPKPILEERWTPGRAFALNPATGGAAGGLAILFVGGFLVLFIPRAAIAATRDRPSTRRSCRGATRPTSARRCSSTARHPSSSCRPTASAPARSGRSPTSRRTRST